MTKGTETFGIISTITRTMKIIIQKNCIMKTINYYIISSEPPTTRLYWESLVADNNNKVYLL